MLQGSQNYIWWTKDQLGKGATAAVYKCRNKKSGEVFAVKVFHPASHQRPADVQMREFELLKKLKHENVVQLLHIEEEQSTKSKVIIMELCNGGSLYSILDEPESAFGLEEKEFITFLCHTSAGMKHLRDQRIVHRDIKPGNIMKLITCEGSSVYKLTDFGAARELVSNEESFASLYGTEEYLHPDLYERAVLRRPFGKRFDATIDLWSLGVTIYHVATGSLPFRPFGGRKNKDVMFKILSEKGPGMISGIQERDGGEVAYSKALPPTCLLSQGLKDLLQPVLAGLLEVDAERCWTFEKFFSEVTALSEKQVFDVYDVCKCSLLRVYISKDACLAKLQDLIAEQSDIRASDQRLIFENALLSDLVGASQEVRTFPRSSSANPVFFFTSSDALLGGLESHGIPKFPKFGAPFNVETDYALSKCCAGIMYLIKRKVDRYLLLQMHLNKAVMLYENFLVRTVALGRFNLGGVVASVEEAVMRYETLAKHGLNMGELFPQFEGHTIFKPSLKLDLRCKELKGKMEDLQHYAEEYNLKLVVNKELSSKWKGQCGCAEDDQCCSKASVLASNVADTLQQFRKDKQAKTLGYNEEQIHKFEKNKMNENCTKAKSLVEDHCYANTKRMFIYFLQWYKMSYKIQVKFKRLEDSMGNLREQQESVSSEVSESQKRYDDLFSETVRSVRAASTSTTGSRISITTLGNGSAMSSGVFDCSVTIKEAMTGLDEVMSSVSEIATEIHKNILDLEEYVEL